MCMSKCVYVSICVDMWMHVCAVLDILQCIDMCIYEEMRYLRSCKATLSPPMCTHLNVCKYVNVCELFPALMFANIGSDVCQELL
jgi:hypothetical protein